MSMTPSPIPVLTLLLCLGGGLAAQSHAAALRDRLERPSTQTILAERSPLTDIQTAGSHQVMVGAAGHILLVDASGKVKQANVPVDLLLTAVKFIDEHTGWAVGHDGVVLNTRDGGLNWSKQLDGRAINQIMLAAAEREVTRLEQASDEAPNDQSLANALDNARFALDDIKAGAVAGPSRPLLDLWFRNAREGWVVGAYGTVLNTVDGGKTWRYVEGLDNPDRLHLNTVTGLADGSVLIAGEGGRLYRILDDGKILGVAQVLTADSLYKLAVLKNGRILVMGFGGNLFSSDDQGVTWQALSLPTKVSLYGFKQLASGAVLLVGQGGVVLYSDGGRSFKRWQSSTQTPLLGVGEVDSKRLLLVGSDGLQGLSVTTLKEQLQ